MTDFIYPVYMRAAEQTIVLWTPVEKLRGTTVESVAELHALEVPYGVTRGVPVG